MKCKKELIFLIILICCMIPLSADGLVLEGTIQGHVYYINTPVSNIDVLLYGKWNNVWVQLTSTTTNSEGEYTLGVSLELGQYLLRVYYNSGCYRNEVFWFDGGEYSININVSPDVLWYDEGYGQHDFSFAVIADPHIGEGEDDYGTEGYEDEPPEGDVGNPAKKLRCTVDWINSYKDTYKIRFVAVLGDITDSGERSEYLKAKEILDALSIPWIPVLGNHDVFPYYRCGFLCGVTYTSDDLPDQWFFEPKYNDLMDSFPSWNWEKEPVPERYYFQQIAFDYGYYHFVCCDFQTRTVALNGIGAKSEADLYELPGGYTWFKNHVWLTPRDDENIIILMHHNFDTDAMGYNCFSFGELDDIKDFFDLVDLKWSISTQFGGHHHESTVVEDESVGLTRVLTDACKSGEAGLLRVVKVHQPRDRVLTNQIIPTDLPYNLCYKASNSITAAGAGSYFIIEDDGEWNISEHTMTAGNCIYLKDGFHAEKGCHFRASTDFWPDDANPMLSTADRAEIAVKDITQAVDKKAINKTKELIPKVFSCEQNLPNPFRNNTTIKYGLPKNCENVNLIIFNIAGQAVRTLVNGQESAGFKQVNWDGKNSAGMQVPQGVYFYVFKADEFEKHRKMILLK